MIATLLENTLRDLALHPASFLLTRRYILLVDLLSFLAVEFTLKREGTSQGCEQIHQSFAGRFRILITRTATWHLELANMLLVLSELVTDVGHGSGSTAMVVDYVWYLWLILMVQVLAMRCCRDVEGLDALLERGADTTAHLLWRIHVVRLDSTAKTLLGGKARNLARADRRIVLQL